MGDDRKVRYLPVIPDSAPYRTPTDLFVFTGLLVGVGLVAVGFLSLLATGYSAWCTNTFDPSDCGSARTTVMVSILFAFAFAFAGAVAWGVGWARRRSRAGIVWAWCGVLAGIVGVLIAVD